LKHSVPPLELPKITSFVSGIFMPMASASPLWSITAKSVMPTDDEKRFDFADGFFHGATGCFGDDAIG
jgi:hypothetical protein